MEHKQKFTQNIVKLLLLCVFLYASLFYIAPFVAENIAKLIGTTKQISVQTRVNSPSLSNFQELTNKDSITFQGVSSGNASVELFLNDSSYGKVTAETDGKFKFENFGRAIFL